MPSFPPKAVSSIILLIGFVLYIFISHILLSLLAENAAASAVTALHCIPKKRTLMLTLFVVQQDVAIISINLILPLLKRKRPVAVIKSVKKFSFTKNAKM